MYHLEGKARIAQWAAEQGWASGVEVLVSQERWDAVARRQADVMVQWPDGRRVAFEIEYKACSAEAWTSKFEDYRRSGVTGVWLFGHYPSRYLRRDTRPDVPPQQPRYRLTPTTEAALVRTGQVLFINPTEGRIGTLFETGEGVDVVAQRDAMWWQRKERVGTALTVTPNRRKASASLGLAALDECLLDPDIGIVTPTMMLVAEEQAAVARLRAAARDTYLSGEAERHRELQSRAATVIRAATPPPIELTPVRAGQYACPVCRERLDPILSKHVLPCGPGWDRF